MQSPRTRRFGKNLAFIESLDIPSEHSTVTLSLRRIDSEQNPSKSTENACVLLKLFFPVDLLWKLGSAKAVFAQTTVFNFSIQHFLQKFPKEIFTVQCKINGLFFGASQESVFTN